MKVVAGRFRGVRHLCLTKMAAACRPANNIRRVYGSGKLPSALVCVRCFPPGWKPDSTAGRMPAATPERCTRWLSFGRLHLFHDFDAQDGQALLQHAGGELAESKSHGAHVRLGFKDRAGFIK